MRGMIPTLLCVAAGAVSAAEDQAAVYHLGFEFGGSFVLANDDRFEGYNGSFGLSFPVSGSLKAGVTHERGHLTGEQNATTLEVNTSGFLVNIRYAIINVEKMELDLQAGLGWVEFDGDIDDETMVAEIAALFAPIKSMQGPIKARMDVRAAYRWEQISEVDSFGSGEEVDDLGGFFIGLGAGIYF